MRLTGAKTHLHCVTGWAVCTHCHYSTTYRMSTDALPSHLVQPASEGEVAGMYCPSCGKDEAGKTKYSQDQDQGGSYILRTGNLTKDAVARLTQAITQGDPANLTEVMPASAPDVANLPTAVLEAAAGALGDAYDCERCWSAWGYGTMGPDDFISVADQSERVAEIAFAIIQAWEQSKTANPCAMSSDPSDKGDAV